LAEKFIVNDLNELNGFCQKIKTQILNSKLRNQIFFFEAQMGAGKTTFIRSLIKSFEKDMKVSSPTFTGMHLYKGKEFDFYHYDLYQVALSLEEFQDILEDEKDKVIFFEWAENLDAKTKAKFKNPNTDTQTLQIQVLDDDVREFSFT